MMDEDFWALIVHLIVVGAAMGVMVWLASST
jgi:hypothetical protein